MASETWTGPATVESAPTLRGQAVDYARAQHVEEPPLGDLKLALAEAINNAVVHAFREGQPGTVTVSVSIDARGEQIQVLVSDDGNGYCPNPHSPGLGLGMPLMATLADSVQVHTPEGGVGTEISMTFHRPRHAA